MTEIAQVFRVGDKYFDTKAEATAFQRKPEVMKAMLAVCGGEQAFATWLVENKALIEDVFDIGKIKRVSKAESRELTKAMDRVVEIADPKTKFLIDNAAAVLQSFRWPKVEKMDSEAKTAAIRNSLEAEFQDDGVSANWIIENRDPILKAYKLFKPERPVSPKATAALAEYREKKAAEKAAAELAAAADTPNPSPVPGPATQSPIPEDAPLTPPAEDTP